MIPRNSLKENMYVKTPLAKRRVRLTWRIIGSILCAAMIIWAIYNIRYLPRNIKQEFSAVELIMTGENEFEILRTLDISINGKLRAERQRQSTDTHSTFNGLFEVSEYPNTLESELTIHLRRRNDSTSIISGAIAHWVYVESDDGNAPKRLSCQLGVLHTDDFSSVLISVFLHEDDDGNQYFTAWGENRFIVAPATDVESAREVLSQYNLQMSDLWDRYVPSESAE